MILLASLHINNLICDFSTLGVEGSACTNNSDCEGALVCDGNLNKCRKEAANIGQYDTQFCSQGDRLCQEWEGDCDHDAECAGDLKCGTDNCNQPQHYSWLSDSDCCYKPGPACTNNTDCAGALVCDGNLKECRNEAANLGQYDAQFCSQGGRLCQEWEGDCDHDAECAGDLKCGTDNCNQPQHYSWLSDSDCCYKPGKLFKPLSFQVIFLAMDKVGKFKATKRVPLLSSNCQMR